MRTQTYVPNAGVNVIGTSLQSLVNSIIDQEIKEAFRLRTILINQVPFGLITIADTSSIRPIIHKLIAAVVRNSKNGEVHITADRFRETMSIIIEERNNYNGYALAFSLRSIEPLARLVGGYISVRGQYELNATITFCFPNQL